MAGMNQSEFQAHVAAKLEQIQIQNHRIMQMQNDQMNEIIELKERMEKLEKGKKNTESEKEEDEMKEGSGDSESEETLEPRAFALTAKEYAIKRGRRAADHEYPTDEDAPSDYSATTVDSEEVPKKKQKTGRFPCTLRVPHGGPRNRCKGVVPGYSTAFGLKRHQGALYQATVEPSSSTI